MTELHHASRLWKDGKRQPEIAAAIGRDVGSLRHKIRERRDLFPRRRQARNSIPAGTNLKLLVSAYLYQQIKKEAKQRSISINMLIREVLRERFIQNGNGRETRRSREPGF